MQKKKNLNERMYSMPRIIIVGRALDRGGFIELNDEIDDTVRDICVLDSESRRLGGRKCTTI